MKKIMLVAAGALALSACGDGGLSVEAMQNSAAEAIDEKALLGAVNRSIDRKAVEDLARGAVAGAVQEAIPPEVRLAGAVIDEKALLEGVDRAVDGQALGDTLKGAIEGAQTAAER
jgi:hypothetical protein